MKPKVIVADDSLTIQKVIKITLANEDFDLVECISDANLRDLIQEHNPLLVLLDFNLSENKTGYDLAKEIRSLGVPKIFMLYGTFDTIDEKLLEHSGVSAHIVKPFEGTKFINQCRQLIEDVELEAQSDDFSFQANEFPDVIDDDEIIDEPEPEIEDDDQWVVNQPRVEEASDEDDIEDEYVSDEIISAEQVNGLEAGMQDWGIDVPGIIGQSAEKQYVTADFPPVIEETEEETSADNFVENDPPGKDEPIIETPIKEVELNVDITEPIGEIETITEAAQEATAELIPDNEDLEYPDVDMIKSTIEAEAVEPTSKLVSVAELAEENTEEFVDTSEGTSTDEEIRDLEALIADEVEENLWAADEIIEDSSSVASQEVHEPQSEDASAGDLEIEAEEVTIIHSEPEEDVVSHDKVAQVKYDLGDLDENKLMEAVAPLVEKLVQKRVDEIIERIAWEVIPDLSENLIKKELDKITESIINSQK